MPSSRTFRKNRGSKKNPSKIQKSKRKKISFTATEMVNRRKKVSFTRNDGTKVSFNATKKVPVKKKVTFYARKK